MAPKYRPEGYKCPYPDCELVQPFKTPPSLGGHVTRIHSQQDLDLIISMKVTKKAKRLK